MLFSNLHRNQETIPALFLKKQRLISHSLHQVNYKLVISKKRRQVQHLDSNNCIWYVNEEINTSNARLLHSKTTSEIGKNTLFLKVRGISTWTVSPSSWMFALFCWSITFSKLIETGQKSRNLVKNSILSKKYIFAWVLC